MVISADLAKTFFEIIEFSNVSWSVIDDVATSDPNILRPIKGVCFEELFRGICLKYMSNAAFSLGPGDSDVDVYLTKHRLQLKTIDKGSTIKNTTIGVALHKTHGQEKRPYNLYSTDEPTFDFLVVLHPLNGILIIPYDKIPKNVNWPGYLADPASFDWDSSWKNRWDLLGFPELKGKSLENRIIPIKSELPKLSAETYLEDYQIIETLCRPEYFRAAVMGLKGNIKEFWLIDFMRRKGFSISTPTEPYPKYDLKITNKFGKEFKVQVKGTSKNMCDASKEIIGVEVMGTHGQFPDRGYRRSFFDYLAVVISKDQINSNYPIPKGPHFIFIPVSDLPLHYLIGKGIENRNSGRRNKRWNLPEFSDVLYPNIKLKTKYDKKSDKVEIFPDISQYKKFGVFDVISTNSRFRFAGPYILDEIPDFDRSSNVGNSQIQKKKSTVTLKDFMQR
jgi:hypothetical protein